MPNVLKSKDSRETPRVLLSGVFGPFGVDDAYGRKENIMELFHNQVTRGQGPASFRFFHRSFGLYFLAENIDAETTVLDFPSRRRFIRELKKGYDLVGISFIAPNLVKAQEMARLAREHCPGATIVLGGHGAAVEGVERLIDCDQVVRGEGIRPLRALLGQDPDAPIVHPSLPSAEAEWIHGIHIPGPSAGLLVPGVGCVNGCKFCSTSHFFGKAYTPYIATGKEMFDIACRIGDERGIDEFFVMDENFLKDKQRAVELMELMERHNRFFKFHIFSSAEAITAFGVDNLVRLGVSFLWIGVESSSPQGNYAKNDGVDARRLVQQLRDRGIMVLASGILCDEHHTPENIDKDIDFMVGLEADFVQFMLLIPLPVTALYQDHKRRGLLREDLPLEEWHGQKYLNYKHPHFPGDLPERWINEAFRREYVVNSSSLYRVTETSLRGYRWIKAQKDLDACLLARLRQLEQRTRHYGLALPGVARFAVNELERQRARSLEQEMRVQFGQPTVGERAMRIAATAMMARWRVRVRLMGDNIQPETIVTRYRAGEGRGAGRLLDAFRRYRDGSETPSLQIAAREALPA